MRITDHSRSSGDDISGLRGFAKMVRDPTDFDETLREEVLRDSPLSAIRTMASTLAHELHQPMTAMVNYLETARRLLAHRGSFLQPVEEALGAAQAEALRAGEIVAHLRDFISRGEASLKVEPIEPILRDAVVLAVRQRGDIEVDYDFQPGVQLVLADRVQIQQVVINLVGNAIQAMKGVGSKRLGLQTRVEDGGFCRITVTDTGDGVPAAVAPGLFFVRASTKSDGLGLGLSICRTIVEAHGGRIWTEAAEPRGTAFRFTLRRVAGQAELS